MVEREKKKKEEWWGAVFVDYKGSFNAPNAAFYFFFLQSIHGWIYIYATPLFCLMWYVYMCICYQLEFWLKKKRERERGAKPGGKCELSLGI